MVHIDHSKINWTSYGEIDFIGGRPKLVLPYVIKPSYLGEGDRWPTTARSPRPKSSESWINAIAPVVEKAVEYYQDTNIHFRRFTEEQIKANPKLSRQFIEITDYYDMGSGGCSSLVGPDPFNDHIQIDVENCREFSNGPNPSPYSAGLIAHELMHALGFLHEHQRPDRDQWIDVDKRAVRIFTNDFEKRKDDIVLSEYDLASLTHYGEREKFITAKNDLAKANIGQSDRLSYYDKKYINEMHPFCYNTCEGGPASIRHCAEPSKEECAPTPVKNSINSISVAEAHLVLGQHQNKQNVIEGIRISCSGDSWNPVNRGYIGVIVYNNGTCCGDDWSWQSADATCRKLNWNCGTWQNGHVQIYDRRSLDDLTGPWHLRPLKKSLSEYGDIDLLEKYGMKFGYFDIRYDGEIVDINQNNVNAYEYAMMVYLVDQWKAKGTAKTYWFNSVDRYFRQKYPKMLEEFNRYPELDLVDEWKNSFDPVNYIYEE